MPLQLNWRIAFRWLSVVWGCGGERKVAESKESVDPLRLNQGSLVAAAATLNEDSVVSVDESVEKDE